MVDLTPEQAKDVLEVSSEFYALATALGVDIHDPSKPYNRAEVEEVKTAFEKAKFGAELGASPSDDPSDILAEALLYNSNGTKPSIGEINSIKMIINDAESNISVLHGLATQHEIQSQNDLYNLAMGLGALMDTEIDLPAPSDTDPDRVSYTQEQIQQVRALYNDALSQHQSTNKNESSAEFVLARRLLGVSADPTNSQTAKNIERMISQAPDNMNYLASKTAQPQNTLTATPITQAQQFRVEIAPEKPVPPDVRASVRELKESLFNIIEGINESDKSANIPLPDDKNNIDGIPDEQFFQSYQATLSYVTGKAVESGFSFGGLEQTDTYTLALRETNLESLLRLKLSRDGGDPKQVKPLFDQLDFLYEKGALDAPVKMIERKVAIAPIVTATTNNDVADTPPPSTDSSIDTNNSNESSGQNQDLNNEASSNQTQIDDKDAIKDAATAIEGLLISIGDIKDLPGVGKIISKIGLADKLYTPLTASDGEFGAHEQDLMSKLIMLMKTADGQEGANGRYSETIGNKLQLSILTKPAFSFIRDNENINVGFYGDDEESIKLAQDLLNFERIKEPADDASEQERALYKQNQKFYERHKEELKSINGLNIIFDSMNTLTKSGDYDNKKAAQVTQTNMMMDMVNSFLPDGMKTWLKDFFVNSEIGQMLGDFLGAFMGFDVAKLWGEGKAGFDPVEDSIKNLGEKFGKTIDKVMAENKDMDFADQMNLVTKDIMGDVDGFGAQAAMVLAVGMDETKFINAAIEDALEAAELGKDKGEAVDIFLLKLDEIGHKYRNNSEITIDGELFVKPDARSPAEIKNDIAASTETLKANGVEFTGREIDAEFISVGENTNIALVFVEDKTNWQQGELRLSNGRVDDIQDVLARNKDALGLSLDPKMMMKADGTTFTDTMNIGTNAFIEETLIRAQIHFLVEEGTEITPEILAGLDRTLTQDNLPMVELYMSAKGVLLDDIDVFHNNATNMMNDYYSTKLPDDPKQDISVWTQSNIGGQFELSMAQFAPVMAAAGVTAAPTADSGVATDPLRDKYLNYSRNGSTNLDKVPCDIPLFYVENGSVFALIREKGDGKGDSDPYNDKYKTLELTDYLKNRSIDDPAILTALQDNYKWNNGSKEGIESFINKILCLEPLAPAVKTAPVVEKEQTTSSAFNNSAGCGDKTPKTFKDLCRLNEAQAAILLENGLDVKKLFEDAIPIKGNGVSRFVIIVPADHGIKGANVPDFIVAMRDGDNIDYRFGNYKADDLVSFETQRMAGMADMKQTINPVAMLRIDDLLSTISVSSGGVVRDSASSTNGYAGMDFIVPNGNGGTMVQGGFRAVYGDAVDEKGAITAYSNGFHARASARTAYQQTVRDMEKIGKLHEGADTVYINAGQRPQNEPAPKVEEEGWFSKLFGSSSDDAPDASKMIEQNVGDMNADAANDDRVYNPHNSDILNLVRPASR